MLYEFLQENRKEILTMTEKKALELAGRRPSSIQLKEGLPIFYNQLIEVLRVNHPSSPSHSEPEIAGMAKAAHDTDEPAMAVAAGQPVEAELAIAAGLHGVELLRLGYTLSHVVHAYGAMCQSITELATKKQTCITNNEFHDLNRCLDIAIAGAVTKYQSRLNTLETNREINHLGSLAHELCDALTSASVSFQMIKRGTVGFGGSTGRVLSRSFKRLEELVARSLTDVRLRSDSEIQTESCSLLALIDQIIVSEESEAQARNQTFEIEVDPGLTVKVDQQFFCSSLLKLIQNAIKYTHSGGKIRIRGHEVKDCAVIEVEDECGGLSSDTDLLESLATKSENPQKLGHGLMLAKRAIASNQGTIEGINLPGKGCILKITLPKKLNTTVAAA